MRNAEKPSEMSGILLEEVFFFLQSTPECQGFTIQPQSTELRLLFPLCYCLSMHRENVIPEEDFFGKRLQFIEATNPQIWVNVISETFLFTLILLGYGLNFWNISLGF